jgi:hypothetical protein
MVASGVNTELLPKLGKDPPANVLAATDIANRTNIVAQTFLLSNTRVM